MAVPEIGLARATTDSAVAAAQETALYLQDQQLFAVRARLVGAQAMLLAKDPITRQRAAAAQRSALQGIQANQILAADLLKRYYKDRPNIVELAVKGVSVRGPATPFRTAVGIRIVDPDHALWNLGGMSGINPAFVAAVQRCAEVDTKWLNSGMSGGPLYDEVLGCDKNPDGSYVQAFAGQPGSSPPVPPLQQPEGNAGQATKPPAKNSKNKSANDSVDHLKTSDDCRRADQPARSRCILMDNSQAGLKCLDSVNAAFEACLEALPKRK